MPAVKSPRRCKDLKTWDLEHPVVIMLGVESGPLFCDALFMIGDVGIEIVLRLV